MRLSDEDKELVGKLVTTIEQAVVLIAETECGHYNKCSIYRDDCENVDALILCDEARTRFEL